MQHNIDWAKTHHQHVIALSSVQRSIGEIPSWKASQNKVHLIVQKYGQKESLRYATGVQSIPTDLGEGVAALLRLS